MILPKTIGLLVIGDELLTGKRQDKHAAAVRERLAARHLRLSWLQYLPDDLEILSDFLAFARQRPAVVFCFGGIGATPDDQTRAAAALAFQRPLQLHPDAAAEIVGQFGEAAYPQRIKMAWLPAEAALIPNVFNRVPGFSLLDEAAQWHFFPGFPQMAWPMLDWVLQNYYPTWQDAPQLAPQADVSIRVQSSESQLIPLLEEAVAKWPALKLYSLPHLGATPEAAPEVAPEVLLGFYGERAQAVAALAWLKERLQAMAFPLLGEANVEMDDKRWKHEG